MNDILILSDDLTGANDSGVQFAKRGISTTVCVDDSGPPEHRSERAVHVINVESRSLSPDETYEKWKRLTEVIDWQGYDIVLKKVDSTLRGNIGIEVQVLMETGCFDVAIIVPAYPRKGRITIGGYHMIHHQLLQDSEISRDPKFPITNSKVTEITRMNTNMLVGEVELNAIRGGDLTAQIHELTQMGIRSIVLDSATNEDLQRIVAELSGQRVLWVGSAGIADALAAQYPDRMKSHSAAVQTPSYPVFVVAGSVSGVTQLQVERLVEAGFASIQIDPMLLLNRLDPKEEIENTIQLEAICKQAQSIIQAGSQLVITTDASLSKREQVAQYLSNIGSVGVNGSNEIADQLGRIASSIIRSERLSGCILTGGDIAYRTLKHLNIPWLTIMGEIEEGLPLCKAEGSLHIPIVTKAGAFGNSDSLLHAAQLMANQQYSLFES